jgi:hypothetical protein
MKKIFFIIMSMLLFSGYAYSQGNNKDVSHANFQLNVSQPVMIVDPGTILLGDAAPGAGISTLGEPYRMTFLITGGANLAVNITGTVAATGSSADCTLNFTWQENAMKGAGWLPIVGASLAINNRLLNGTGQYEISVLPSSVTVGASALAGPRSFEVTLTTTYATM